METFAPPKPFVSNPAYSEERERAATSLDLEQVDAPIRGIIRAFTRLPHCFTLQSCCGHFLHSAQTDLHNTDRLPDEGVGDVKYRIAYLALCIEDSVHGRNLRSLLATVPLIDPDYVQFASPDWFWERQLNSYALQVEPERMKDKDAAAIGYQEALRIQATRDLFFMRITEITHTTMSQIGRA